MARGVAPPVAVRAQLFDRFEGRGGSAADRLSADLADLLGSRRPYSVNLPGILSWGLPGMGGISPGSDSDREQVAEYIADAIRRFEPRLANVVVTPEGEGTDFAFLLEAQIVGRGGVRLLVNAPRRGGGLSADVTVAPRTQD